MKMKKTTLIVFLLAAFAPMAQVWAYNSNYYYSTKVLIRIFDMELE